MIGPGKQVDVNSNMALIVPAPNPGGETGVNHEMVRHFIWDRTIEDNPLELDLEFSDQEIGHARKYAVMSFNAIPPFVFILTQDNVPQRLQYPFMLNIIYHLFIAKMAQLARKDLEYSAGNMSVDINKRRIDYLAKWAQFFKEESTASFKEIKVTLNLESAYGCI